MKEKVHGFWDGVKALWGGMTRIARIVLLCVAVGILAAIIVLAIQMNRKEYVLFNTDFNRSETAMAMAVLAEQGIDYKVSPNGVIMVLNSDEDKAHMQLAVAGLPGGLYDSTYSPGLTSTQSDKNYLQNNELQKRLQSIIQTYEEVDTAAVTIAQPERGAFALAVETIPPSANVHITRSDPTKPLTSEQVQGIVNLVKHSVPGIDEENISVTDSETGNIRNALDPTIEVNNAKLRLTEEVNALARGRAMSMLTKIYGGENVEVQVNSVIDTDTRTGKQTTYMPLDEEDPTNNPYNYAEYDRELLGERETLVGGVVGANDNVGTPEYAEELNQNDGIASYRVHDMYDFLVGSIQEEFSKEGLVITDASAAVVINRAQLTEGELDRIMTMVSNSTGIAVENVSVHNFVFDTGPEIETPTGPGLPPVPDFTPMQILILCLIAAVVLIILIVTIVLIVNKRKRDAEAAEEDLEGLEYDEDGMPLFDLMDQEEDFEPITLMETNEQKLRAQIKDLADSDPEIVASLLKNWLSSTT